MKNAEELKKEVAEKYASIAKNETSCCGPEAACAGDYSFIGDEYNDLEGYAPDADLGLGCGLPTEFAQIQTGQVVVDLGSGAGNDCFIARAEVGTEGRVIGVDFTPEMIAKAQQNTTKLGYDNVEFVQGDIENIPLEANLADVAVSNCVMNLVPDKQAAFNETFRILKPGGHFSISDVVTKGNLPENLKEAAELYAGCVSGAMDQEAYLSVITEAGFKNITIQKSKEIQLPDSTLEAMLTPQQLAEFKKADVGIYSITVFGKKPSADDCCDPTCCN